MFAIPFSLFRLVSEIRFYYIMNVIISKRGKTQLRDQT